MTRILTLCLIGLALCSTAHADVWDRARGRSSPDGIRPALSLGGGFLHHASRNTGFGELGLGFRKGGPGGGWIQQPIQVEAGVTLLMPTDRLQADVALFAGLDVVYVGFRVHVLGSFGPGRDVIGLGAELIGRVPIRLESPNLDLQVFVRVDGFPGYGGLGPRFLAGLRVITSFLP